MRDLIAEFSPIEIAVVKLDALGGAKLLRIQLLPISEKPIAHPDFPKGLRFDRAFAEKLVANFSAYEGKVPLDYGHGSEKNDATPDQAVAAGWFRAVRIEGNEVVGYAEPTARALAMVEAREYLLASAAMNMDWLNPATGKRQGPILTSAALTNRPHIRGMQEVAVVDRRSVTLTEAPASRHADGAPRPEEREMGEPSLKLSESTVALADHQATLVKLTEVQTKLADAEKARDSLQAKLTASETEKVALGEKIKALEGEKAKTARLAKFDALLREGRVLPAEKEGLLELSDAQFEKITSTRPKGMWKSKAKGVTADLEDTAAAASKDAGVKLHERAEEISTKRKVSYREALDIAMLEDPTLKAGTASPAVRRGLVMLSNEGVVDDSNDDAGDPDDDEGDEE